MINLIRNINLELSEKMLVNLDHFLRVIFFQNIIKTNNLF